MARAAAAPASGARWGLLLAVLGLQFLSGAADCGAVVSLEGDGGDWTEPRPVGEARAWTWPEVPAYLSGGLYAGRAELPSQGSQETDVVVIRYEPPVRLYMVLSVAAQVDALSWLEADGWVQVGALRGNRSSDAEVWTRHMSVSQSHALLGLGPGRVAGVASGCESVWQEATRHDRSGRDRAPTTTAALEGAARRESSGTVTVSEDVVADLLVYVLVAIIAAACASAIGVALLRAWRRLGSCTERQPLDKARVVGRDIEVGVAAARA